MTISMVSIRLDESDEKTCIQLGRCQVFLHGSVASLRELATELDQAIKVKEESACLAIVPLTVFSA